MKCHRLLAMVPAGILLLLLPCRMAAADFPQAFEVGLQPLKAQVKRVVEAMDYLGFPLGAADRKELEAIVTQLESGQTSLEESIGLYERGEKLKSRCEALLKNAEMRIEKINLSADGAPKGTGPLDIDQ